MNNYVKISNTEIIMIIIGVIAGERLISLASILTTEVGYASVASVFFGGLLALITGYIISRLALNFPDKTITQYSNIILGKVLGKMFTSILFIYFIIFISNSLRRAGEAIKGTLLYVTPIEFIMLTLILVSGYCVSGGMATFSKVTDLLLSFALIAVLVLILASLPFANFEETLPVFQLYTLKQTGVLMPGLVSYAGLEIILFLIPFMKKPKDIKKSINISILFVLIVFISNVFLSMAILTKDALIYRIYPVFDIAKIMAFPGTFDIRADIIFEGYWVLLIFLVISGYHYLSSITLSDLVGVKVNSVIVFLITPIIYVLALIPQNFGEVLSILKILEYFWLYGIMGGIFFIYIFGVLTKKVKL